MSSPHEFPSPVGGVPLPIDFAPSVLFSILFAFLVPVGIWRIVNPRTRNFLLIGTTIFTLERFIGFALRAAAARNASLRTTVGLEAYFQATLGGGFVTMAQDLTAITRALLVHSTNPPKSSPPPENAGNTTELATISSTEGAVPPSKADLPDSSTDHPKTRKWIRTWIGLSELVYLACVIMTAIIGGTYKTAVNSGGNTPAMVQQLRYASTALALFLMVCLLTGSVWVATSLPRVPRMAIVWVFVVVSLLSTVATYRLVVMRFWTTSLYTVSRESLNAAPDKIIFYILQVVPEYLSAAILLGLNVRDLFATGLCGDRQFSRPKPPPTASSASPE